MNACETASFAQTCTQIIVNHFVPLKSNIHIYMHIIKFQPLKVHIQYKISSSGVSIATDMARTLGLTFTVTAIGLK